jgi:hypothetical protein
MEGNIMAVIGSMMDVTGLDARLAGRLGFPKSGSEDSDKTAELTEDDLNPDGTVNEAFAKRYKDAYEFTENGVSYVKLNDPYGIIKARDERIEQQKLTGSKGFLPEDEEPIDIFDNQAMLGGLEIEFNTGSHGKAIVDILGYTAINAYIVADDFVQKVQQTYYNRSGTIEERTLNRELAFKNGQQIVGKYLGGAALNIAALSTDGITEI